MRKIFSSLLVVTTFLVISCNKYKVSESNPTDHKGTLSKKEINQKIINEFKTKNDFSWNNLSDEDVWTATELSDYRVSIAWPVNEENDSDKDKIIDFILESENITKIAFDEILINENTNLDIICVIIKNKKTLIGLRAMKEVELVEPAYAMYTKEEAMDTENGVEQESISYRTLNKNTTEANASFTPPSNFAYPSYFDNHNIKKVWQAGINGNNIKCAIVDGGVKPDNSIFGINGNINGANTNGRTFERRGYFNPLWFLPFTTNDGVYETGFQLPSNHGTDMCIRFGGPLGNNTGVAYNSDLISIRTSWSVWIDPLENNIAVSKAFEYLANRNDVKIISMSMGSVLPWIWVTRAIDNCKAKGKLIFCAAGTFPVTQVIQAVLAVDPRFTLFPARLNTVVACTGIKKLSSTNNIPQLGAQCFGVSDFIFEFDETNTTNIGQGSSSVATCSNAGMATLIWSKQPSLTANQVLNKMKAASDYPLGNHSYFGYGRVNMQKYLDNEGL